MYNKKFIIILISIILYQSSLLSKSDSFDEFNSKNLSKYFSGIVAFENKENSIALNYFNSSKILINQHDPYLERLVMSLVLEDKVIQAVNYIKANNKKNNTYFFEAYVLLALDSIKKNTKSFLYWLIMEFEKIQTKKQIKLKNYYKKVVQNLKF